MNRSALRFIAFGMATIVGLLGCTKPIEVEYDYDTSNLQSDTVPAIEVHVIGVNDANLQKFQNYFLDDFFDPSKQDSLRTDVLSWGGDKVLEFGPNDKQTKMIAGSDPIWKEWKKFGATHLLVLQNYPRTIPDHPLAKADPRYLDLPLDQNRWIGNTLLIRISRSGPSCESGTDEPGGSRNN
jgi:hypothetical protein